MRKKLREQLWKERCRDQFIEDIIRFCYDEGIDKQDIPEIIKQALKDLDAGVRYV